MGGVGAYDEQGAPEVNQTRFPVRQQAGGQWVAVSVQNPSGTGR